MWLLIWRLPLVLVAAREPGLVRGFLCVLLLLGSSGGLTDVCVVPTLLCALGWAVAGSDFRLLLLSFAELQNECKKSKNTAKGFSECWTAALWPAPYIHYRWPWDQLVKSHCKNVLRKGLFSDVKWFHLKIQIFLNIYEIKSIDFCDLCVQMVFGVSVYTVNLPWWPFKAPVWGWLIKGGLKHMNKKEQSEFLT